MQIGMFKPATKDFDFIGHISTLAVDGQFALKRVRSINPEAPFFDLYRKSPVHGKFVKVAGAWQKTSNSSGESFYVATLRDAGFSKGSIRICFFHQDDNLALAWQPTKELNARRAANRRQSAEGTQSSDGAAGWGRSTDRAQRAA